MHSRFHPCRRRALGSLGGTLLHLHLDRNRLACVPPEALAGLGKVRDLSLAGNELEELPGTVGAAAAATPLLRRSCAVLRAQLPRQRSLSVVCSPTRTGGRAMPFVPY